MKKNNPFVVLVIDDSTSYNEIKKSVKQGVDILEVRIDRFSTTEEDHLKTFFEKMQKLKLPLLLTVRSVKEGGVLKLTETERKKLFFFCIPYVDYVDIELSSVKILKQVVSCCKKFRKKIILSFHDFNSTPSVQKLIKIKYKADLLKYDFLKIAVKANSLNDLKRTAKFLLENDKLIVIAMGEIGKISRVFFPALGSELIYTFIGQAKAPGQLPLKDVLSYLKKFY